MQQLACLFRAAQLYAHSAHNQIRGASFFSDHEFLGELYSEYEEAYDSVIEQMIGLNMGVDISQITKCACDLAVSLADPALFPSEMSFQVLMKLETDIQAEIARLTPTADIGTQNMIAQFYEDSQHRANYKIGQRLKK